MARRIRAFAWQDTPLGPIETWPPALRTVVDLMLASPQPVYIAWGPELISLYNDGYIDIAGAKHPQALGQPYRVMWAEIWDEIRTVIERTAFHGESYIFHDRPLAVAGRPDRPLGWFTTTATPIRDDGGRPVGLYTVALETTDRVLAEAGLKQSFEVLFDSIDEGLAVTEMLYDDDGQIVDMVYRQTNAAFERHGGVYDVVGRSIFDVLPNVEDHWLDLYRSVARTGEPIRRENHQQDVDRWFDCYFARVDPAGRFVVTVFNDITNRKRADAVLREREARHRLLIGTFAQAVWETDADGVVVHDSPSWRAYTGQTIDEWLGYGWADAVHPDDRAFAQRQWREAIVARQLVDADFRLRSPDGGWRWTNVLAAPVLDVDGRIEKWAGMNVDIDTRKRAEHALRESEERQAFLLKLSDALRAEPDADAVAHRAIRMLLDHLGLDRCYIATYRPDDDAADFAYQTGNDSVPPLPPSVRLSDFPDAYAQVIDRTFVVNDDFERRGLSQAERDSSRALGMRAMLASTIRRGEKRPLSSMMAVASRPRHWTRGEIALVEETAERTWAAMERARREAALCAAQLRLEAVVENIPQLVWRADRPGRWTWASSQWTDFTGQAEVESHDWGWLAPLHPDDRDAARAAWALAERDGEFSAEYRICERRTGLPRWFQTRATPLKDADGTIVEWFGTSTDIDDLRRLQERQQILVKELQHRTFNLMGIVRSAADMTIRSSNDLDEFRGKFRDRIDALARVQRLLSQLDENDRLSFGDLIRAELGSTGVLGGDGHRVTLDGPPDVALRSSTVQTLAMALHELTTNAVKYGALGQAGGQLDVRWRVAADATGQPWLHVDWHEHGVAMPPPDAAARHRPGAPADRKGTSVSTTRKNDVRYGTQRHSLLDCPAGFGGTTRGNTTCR